MSKIIRPLTLNERKRPASLSFVGGFKNVSFQIGELVMPESSEKNVNGTTASFSKGFIRKGEKVQIPIVVPNALGPLKGPSTTVASVIGQKNKYGGYDAMLVARSTARLSSFNSKLRTVEDLVRTSEVDEAADEPKRLGKSSAARVHNQVMLAGVVVGSNFEDGEQPRFYISLRQDSNPDNVVPLCYEARNASALAERVRYGALIYVDGEYAARYLPVHELDADGAPKRDQDNNLIPVLDENGKPMRRIHTYIRITSPKDPAEFDTDFGGAVPKWVAEIADEIAKARAGRIQRSQKNTGDAAKDANSLDDL